MAPRLLHADAIFPSHALRKSSTARASSLGTPCPSACATPRSMQLVISPPAQLFFRTAAYSSAEISFGCTSTDAEGAGEAPVLERPLLAIGAAEAGGLLSTSERSRGV